MMYLPLREVDFLFNAIQQGRARFLFTFMELQPDGQPQFRNATCVSKSWLNLKREPFLWGLAPQDMESFLDQRGFRLQELWGADELRNGIHLGQRDSALGEWVALAEKLAS